jgi:RimJ/RimL family protein N-acetyltransferase
VRHDDVGAVAPAFTDPAVGGEAGLPPLDEEQLHAFLDHVLPQRRPDGRVVPYVIEESGELLGGVTLHHLDPLRRAIEIGYRLLARARGRGGATRAVTRMADWAFANGFNRIEALVRVGNRPSERVLERTGFTREGVTCRFVRYEGALVDSTLYSRLAADV